MENGHLTYEEIERYTMEADLSEEYLCFSEPLTAHLDACALCRGRLDKMLLLTELWEEENISATINLVRKEEKLRRKVLALRLEIMAEEQRMLEVARRLQLGLLMNLSVTKADFGKNRNVYRCGGKTEQKPVTVYYENGQAFVSVISDETADVTVIMVPSDKKDAAPLVAKAKWHEERKVAIAEFAVEKLEENYEIYVDILKR